MCPIITAVKNRKVHGREVSMTKMVDIEKCTIDECGKKKSWVKPEIRILAHDDPLVKHFESLAAEEHCSLFSKQITN
jgi:hypothetical protein